MMTKREFSKIFKRLPEPEKSMPICVLDGEPYSWNVVNAELEKNTEISKKMLEQISMVLQE